MKTIKIFSLILALNAGLASAQITFDSENAVTTTVAPPAAERNSKDRPVEVIDTERGFDPSVMPVDVHLKFTYTGEATSAEIIVSGAIQTNEAKKLNKIWLAAPALSKVYKVNLKKGHNSLSLTDLPVHKAAENFIDTRKKGQVGRAIGFTFKVLVRNNEVGSIRVDYPAHLQ